MGELVRRLDYERRSRQSSLLKGAAGGQRINKEYSTSVRSANEMEERKKDLYVKRMELHKKLFINRLNYEKKIVEKFKTELDAKSPNFKEETFQQIHRAQSAMARLQSSKPNTNIGPVTELLPRHYYRTETNKQASAVKFSVSSSESSSDDDEDDEDDDIFEDSGKCGYKLDSKDETDNTSNRRPQTSLGILYVKHLSSMSKKKQNTVNRRRMSCAQLEDMRKTDHTSLPIRTARRQSAPPRVLSAFIPRDLVNRASARRSSVVSVRSDTHPNEESTNSATEIPSAQGEMETASSSFRLLKEAFKKQIKETPNPKLEKLNKVKADHQLKTHDLHERTIKKFNDLLSENVFNVVF